MRETERLAEFVAASRFEDVPDDVIERMKLYILDSLGAGLLGSHLRWSRIVQEAESENDTSPVCSVFGSTELMSPASASLVNGTMVGAFEAEHTAHISHPSGTVIPAALATAEATGATGQDVLLACVMGYETVCRVGEAQTAEVEDKRGFHNPSANGPFSSAAAVGKLLGLDGERQTNAFGIAGSMAGGLIEFQRDGAMTKRLHIGLACRGGLAAAYLAERGFTGPDTVLEGRFGYLSAFSPAPRPDRLAAGLGSQWLTRDVKIKPYAVHGTVQALVAALEEFKAGHVFDPASVSRVHVRASTERILMPRFLDPSPSTLLQAQLSMPFVVAIVLHRDLSDPLQFDESTLQDEQIGRLAHAVTWEPCETDDPAFAFLHITAGDETHEVYAGPYRGSTFLPAGWEDVVDKFHRYSAGVLDDERRKQVVSEVATLDSADDVRRLMALVRH